MIKKKFELLKQKIVELILKNISKKKFEEVNVSLFKLKTR